MTKKTKVTPPKIVLMATDVRAFFYPKATLSAPIYLPTSAPVMIPIPIGT